jgi:hypothetical protein
VQFDVQLRTPTSILNYRDDSSSRLFRNDDICVPNYTASNSINIYFNPTSFVVKTLVISVVISKDLPKTKNLKLCGDRSLLAKLVPTSADRRVLRSQRGGSLMALISVF